MMTMKTYAVVKKVSRNKCGKFVKPRARKVMGWSSANALQRYLGHNNFTKVGPNEKFTLSVSLTGEKRRDRKNFYKVN